MSSMFARKTQDTPATGWTAPRVETLKAKWAEGWSANQIANHLGVTRNAAIGKLKRLGLLGAGPEDPAKQKHRRTTAKMVSIKHETAPLPYEPPAAPGAGISLFDLTNSTCRWPSGTVGSPDFHFCGAGGADLIASRPYCREHTRMARKL